MKNTSEIGNASHSVGFALEEIGCLQPQATVSPFLLLL